MYVYIYIVKKGVCMIIMCPSVTMSYHETISGLVVTGTGREHQLFF